MNPDALVQRGRVPWSPTSEARDLDIWHEYDNPLAGTFRVRGETVLFTAVGDSSGRLSVWAYACLTEEEARDTASAEFDSVEHLRDFVDRTFAGRQTVVFVLADDVSIEQWAPLTVQDQLVEAATAFLSQVLSTYEQRHSPSERFRAKLAEVDAAAAEFVDA